uniref:Trehalase n=1 Tax=Diaphorina citri TaxID=121845 RepID=A0A7U3UAT2_DIACI|nr:trehalase [Diaphorina citri]
MVLSETVTETVTETLPSGTDEADKISLIALDDFLPCPVAEDAQGAGHYLGEKSSSPELRTIDDFSQIYCKGELLDKVQRGNVFPNDSKSFVDLKLKQPEDVILAKFRALLTNNADPDTTTLTNFVNEYFEAAPDAHSLRSLDIIRDVIAKHNGLLGPIRAEGLEENVPVGLAADGRFSARSKLEGGHKWAGPERETGVRLLRSIEIIKNVSRVSSSCQNDTEKPLYDRPTKTDDCLQPGSYIFLFAYSVFWARYYAPSRGPRPESYREDYHEAADLQTEDEKNFLYSELKAGAETGWDFSSRWFIARDGSNRGGLKYIRTTSIIPVDLNAILQMNANYLSEWWLKFGNKDLSAKYKKIAYQLLEAIHEVLWNEQVGVWLDYDIKNKKPRNYFYVSNITPLWTLSYKFSKQYVAERVLQYLRDNEIITKDNQVKFYGTPTSLFNSTQQWDYPNAWAPLQAFIIQGLDYTQDKLAKQVAYRLAEKWLFTNYMGYETSKAMFEKYDVELIGKTGNGGEYEAQTGFGWTNGFAFELLNRYGKTISFNNTQGSYYSKIPGSGYLSGYYPSFMSGRPSFMSAG